MARSVVLLRGINVGGRSLPMAELRRICLAAGCTEVETHIQSGNVVLAHPSARGAALETMLESAIRDATGLDVPVLVRTAADLAALVAHNPYPGAEGTKLVVWFLRSADEAARLGAFDASPFAPETLVVGDREVYLSLPHGQGRSPLLGALDKVRPKVTCTARNWNTVEKLLAMATA
jgi:uncharacterized protein (DUF1697 family)